MKNKKENKFIGSLGIMIFTCNIAAISVWHYHGKKENQTYPQYSFIMSGMEDRKEEYTFAW